MNLTWSIFRFDTTFEMTLLKVLFGFSHFEAVSTDKSVHWCPAHYRLTQTNTPLFTMFVGADSLNNAGMMEMRECLHVFFCICVKDFIQFFHSVPVCKPAVLKTKGEKSHIGGKIGGQTGRRDEVNQANHHFDFKNTLILFSHE